MSLAEPPVAPKPQVDASIRAALGGLRRRIRLYVLAEGLAAVVIWLGVTFWAGFALDYLPVLLGASEMPQLARGVLLAIVAIGAGYVTYRWLLSRLTVPLSDRSLALLLERRHRDFHDSLVTTVELNDRENDQRDPLTNDMLVNTGRQAVDELRGARLGDVFNYRPLLRNLALAALFVITIVAAYATNAGAMTKAAKRLYGLDNELWERFAKIDVLGIEVRRPSQDATSGGPQSLTFNEALVKVARGSNVTLRVEADTNAPKTRPEQCYLNYRTEEGDRGTVTIKRVGSEKDGKQLYVCDAKPLAGILSSLDFDVLGYDHRLGGFRIEVVDSPAVVVAKMDLRYPAYMVDEKNAIHLPRVGEQVLSSGNPLPQGTHVTLHFTSSKPLAQADVRLLDPQATEPDKIEVQATSLGFSLGENVTAFTYEIPALPANRTIEVALTDTDGVTSERAYRAFLTAIPDEAPRWELALRGIGTQITPDAIVPLVGKVTDDYGVASIWLDATIGELEPVKFDVERQKGSEVAHSIDFRQQRTDREAFRLSPGQRVAITGRATDRFDLGKAPNEGVSERFVLEVVTPDQLLASLEARELALRRRFEQIIEELTAMRDSLLRIKPDEKAVATIDPEDAAEPGETKLSPQELARREAELRVLRVQRALQQGRKSSQEIGGVAQAFDSIREELGNNRVDTEDRKVRLKEQIADPLHAVVAMDFVQLEELLLALEPLANDAAQGPAAVEASLTKSNDLLAKLDQVLQKMLRLESFNEVVDALRDLIREEKALAEDTKKLQRRSLLDDDLIEDEPQGGPAP
jgi:hypothetical protein